MSMRPWRATLYAYILLYIFSDGQDTRDQIPHRTGQDPHQTEQGLHRLIGNVTRDPMN